MDLGRWLCVWLVALLGLTVSAPLAWSQDLGEGPAATGETAPAEDEGAEDAAEAVSTLDLSSPRATLRSLLTAVRAGDLELARLAVDLEYVSDAASEESVYLASDVSALVVDGAIERFAEVVLEFPRAARDGAPAATELPGGFEEIPLTLEGEVGGRRARLELNFALGEDGLWRVAEPSFTNTDELFDRLDPVRSRLRKDGFGTLIDNSFAGLAYYQWLGLFALIFIGVVVDLILRTSTALIVRRYLRRSEDTATADDTGKLIARLGRIVGLGGGALFVYLTLPWLELPGPVESLLRGIASVVASLSSLVFAYRLVDIVAEFFQRKTAKTDSTFDDLLVPLIRKAVKVFIFAIGVVAVAEAFNLPITSLVAGLGIGGLALAFAAKDTIENLFGSVAVVMDRPFNVGDWVVVDDVEGTVEELGFRSTRIRTFYNSLVTVPNAGLVRAKVDNYGRRSFRRYKSTLSVTYDTPPDTLEAFCEGVRELIRKHPYTRKDYYLVYFRDFGASSLDIMLYMFFRTPDWDAECRERHKLGLDILRLAHELGVGFAFPTQTIELKRAEQPGEDPLPSIGDGTETAAKLRGREAASAVLGRGEDGG